MWVWCGFILSLGLAGLAWWRSRAPSRTFYEGEVYGMTPAFDRRYALGFAIAAVVFLAELVWPELFRLLRDPLPWWPEAFLALVVLTGILYGATFLRGASGEDE